MLVWTHRWSNGGYTSRLCGWTWTVWRREGEEESDHHLGCDILVLSRISSNSPNVHNPLTSGIPFGIFHHLGKMNSNQIEMNCSSKYSFMPPQMIPQNDHKVWTQIPNVTRDKTGYPIWYRLVTHPLRQMTIAERIFANSTIKRQSLVDLRKQLSPIRRSKLRHSMDSLHLLVVR